MSKLEVLDFWVSEFENKNIDSQMVGLLKNSKLAKDIKFVLSEKHWKMGESMNYFTVFGIKKYQEIRREYK